MLGLYGCQSAQRTGPQPHTLLERVFNLDEVPLLDRSHTAPQPAAKQGHPLCATGTGAACSTNTIQYLARKTQSGVINRTKLSRWLKKRGKYIDTTWLSHCVWRHMGSHPDKLLINSSHELLLNMGFNKQWIFIYVWHRVLSACMRGRGFYSLLVSKMRVGSCSFTMKNTNKLVVCCVFSSQTDG